MFGDQFRQASYPGNDQPPEIRSCHTAVLGVIRSLKIVKREQGTYWKICHSCFWKYELHFLPFNSSWKEFKVLQSLQEIETYASPVSDPILNSAPSVMVVCCDKRLFDWCIVFGNEAPLFHRTGQFLLHGFFFFLSNLLKFVFFKSSNSQEVSVDLWHFPSFTFKECFIVCVVLIFFFFFSFCIIGKISVYSK